MVSLKLFAGTDVGLRENNEDNFIVCPDLDKNEWIVPADYQQVIRLGSRGCVMVVADGMGGQNAGEVASAIAVDTVRRMFSTDNMPADVFDRPDGIKSYLKRVIYECDVCVKRTADGNPSTSGMGSTIVIAWLIGCRLYIAWLGDSRAYAFVKNKGIARLSKDHSYVQQLVDSGAITEEEAMHHPNSNVITRSLGDPSQKAKAEVAEYDIEDGEVVMLCTDGLCGVCTDAEIGGIIEDCYDNLQQCKEKLTTAALAAGGSDNITIALMQINVDSKDYSNPDNDRRWTGGTGMWIALSAALCLCVLVGVILFRWLSTPPVDRVTIWLDRTVLSPGERTPFHILKEGVAEVTLDYDRRLLEMDLKDSMLIVKKTLCLGDTTVYVKVSCTGTAIADSVDVTIKGCSVDLPVQIDDILNDEANGTREESVGASHKKNHSEADESPESAQSGNEGGENHSEGAGAGLTSSSDQNELGSITSTNKD